MLNKRNSIYFIGFLTIVSYITIGSYTGPENGHTGAPGEGLCSDCHDGPDDGQDGDIYLYGLPQTIYADSTYMIRVSVKNPNEIAEFGGFQLVVLDGSNQNAGELSNNSSSTFLSTAGNGRVYWKHLPAKQFQPPADSVTYTVKWKAPSGPDLETIKMYVAGNIANGDTESSGDLIVATNKTGTLMINSGGNPDTLDLLAGSYSGIYEANHIIRTSGSVLITDSTIFIAPSILLGEGFEVMNGVFFETIDN